MNIIAIDIGNTKIAVSLFIDDLERMTKNIVGADTTAIRQTLVDAWQQVPIVPGSNPQRHDCTIVCCSVKPQWTQLLRQMVNDELGEKLLEVGYKKDIPLPMDVSVDDISKVGVDRIMNAAAAFAVVQDAVAVADFGTAVTIDLVDEQGVFLGGVILPGFELSADALKNGTAALPKIEQVHIPKEPFGRNTQDAINNGLYYAAVGVLEVVLRSYAEELGRWPQAIVTGGAMEILKDGCSFVDSFVSNLTVKGIVMAYQKYCKEKSDGFED